MIKSLVTGGAGFIGAHVVNHLLKMGHKVVVLDDLSGGFMENINPDAIFVKGSITDNNLLEQLFAEHKFTYVYHLAAYAAEGISHFIRRFNYQNNLIGSINLINEAIKHKIKCFVFTSSIAVYGTNTLPMIETATPNPEDPYGIAKYAFELDLKAAHEMFGLNYIIFRPHNVYGKYQNIDDKYRNVIGIFMNQLLRNMPLTIYGNGEQTRAFSYIDDVAPYISQSVDIPNAYNEIFNIGGDKFFSVKKLAEAVMKAMKTEGTIKYLDARKEVMHAYADHHKVKRVFNIEDENSNLTDGLRKMAEWAKKRGTSDARRSYRQFEVAATNPYVSIIMAIKDTEPYLHACLDSIIAQTYTDWELIAVNDHSTDRTLEILNDYAAKDKRIRVFNSDGQKLIPALRYGHKQCRGTLINRMDSDDIMPDYKLKVLIDEWEKYGKGTVIAGGTEHFVDEGEVGEGFRRYERWLNDVAKRSAHYDEIYQECVIPSHCWIIHKDDFNKVDAFNPDVYPEDYDLCFRFYRANLKIVGLDKILHYWRDRSDRISRTWDCYKDNRYFDLKIRFFYELDRDKNRPLVLWGAGRNGKDMAKLLQLQNDDFHWVCDNQRKIGKDIYGIRMEHFDIVPTLKNPQIMIVVMAPDGKVFIRNQLMLWNKKPVSDFWFFA